jgi:hypothetical protein
LRRARRGTPRPDDLKNTVNQNLTDQQRLERLAQTRKELQAAVVRPATTVVCSST